MIVKRAVHFVGFRHDREYLSAILVFGKPDYIHQVHDRRMYREVVDGDLVVFGSKGYMDYVCPYNGADILEEDDE